MPRISELLTDGERKILKGFTLFVLFLLVIFVFSLFFWGHRLTAVRQEAEKGKADLEKVLSQVEKLKDELLSWQVTVRELQDMKKNAFFPAETSLEEFRAELKRLFEQSGLPLPAINYQYQDAEKKELKKLSASFNLRLSYPLLKRFLYQLETWPRFFVLEQINFQKIDNLSGVLDLRLTVAGFYYEKK